MTTNNFLPPDYEEPGKTTNYFKTQQGENRIRILTNSIQGWETWDNKKPLRYRFKEKPTKSINSSSPIKIFWAMVVWDYRQKKILIWVVAQSTIREAIKSLSISEDWGAPHQYDLKIIRTGEGVDTAYAVNPCPAKPVSDEIKRAFQENPCCLDALYYNEDPFSVASEGTPTKGAFE